VRIALIGTGVTPIPPVGYGSISQAIWELSQALQAAGHDVRIVNSTRRGVQVDQFGFARDLAKLLGSAPTDIVHAHTGLPGLRLHLLDVPYVYTTHNPAWFVPDRTLYRWNFWLDRWATVHSSVTITESERVAAVVRRYLGGRRDSSVRTIPHGIDLGRFPAAPSAGDGHVALGLGAIRRIKRWDVAVRALDRTGIRLRIVGPVQDPGYAEELRRMGPVDLLGEISADEVVREMHAAGFLVHPSASETFGLSVAESLACGRPVVASPAVAPLLVDGVTGFVAPERADDEAGLVRYFHDRALELSQDAVQRERMGREGRRWAEAHYAWDKVAAAHLEIYREVLDRTGPAMR
jgi:starch synthase